MPGRLYLLPWMACMLVLQEQKPATEKSLFLEAPLNLMKHNFSLLVLLSTLLFWSDLLQAEVTVSIDRNPVRVNESFQFFFETDTSVDGDPDFSPLQQYFQILNTSQSNNISIINGKYQRSLKWTLLVMPGKEGDFVLPAIKFGKDESELFRVTVKPASQSSVLSNEGLVFELSSDEVPLYVQSQVIVTLRLMSDSNISGYQMGDLVIEDMDVVIEPLGEVKQYQTRLDDKPYLVLERQFALFPQQSGTLNIGPILAEVQYGSRSRSIFDPFQSSGKLKRISSGKLSLEVLAKPESFDAPFWFPSTAVNLSEDWLGELSDLTAGEPVTRIISLTAEGLTAAQLPDLLQVDVAGIKQYPDKPVFEDKRSSQGITGIRQQRTAIIPTGAGRYTLPEITIPWWNLETGKQEVARLPARTIEVNRAVNEAVVLQPETDLIPVLSGDPVKAVDVQPESKSYWVWISLLLAVGWAASMLAWWVMRGRINWRRTESTDSVEVGLREAKKCLHRACVSKNASQARSALLSWANAVVVKHKFVNLNQVTRYFGNPLKQQVDKLNQALYSPSTGDWNGELLWDICELISAELIPSAETGRLQSLRPLNP